jgi:hypothetical protein
MTLLRNTHAFARRGRKHMLVCFAAGGLCGTGLSSSAIANPPLIGGKSPVSTFDSARSVAAAGSRSAVRQENTSAPQLDLRPPLDSSLAVILGPAALASYSGTDDLIARPSFGTREALFPVMNNQPGSWLHRARREGLPIIRLWNSKSALLSIGLNQKGKPGLWLIQKTP